MAAARETAPRLGAARTCRALGLAKASYYRRLHPFLAGRAARSGTLERRCNGTRRTRGTAGQPVGPAGAWAGGASMGTSTYLPPSTFHMT